MADEFSMLLTGESMSVKELEQLYYGMYMTHVNREIVSAVLDRHCGRGAMTVSRQKLVDVLQDIHDQKILEENAYWDFQALVMNDDQTIRPQDALIFMRAVHADMFSFAHWEKFQSFRPDPTANISWFEIKPWVCDIPLHGDVDDQAYQKALINIDKEVKEKNQQLLQKINSMASSHDAKKVFDYIQTTKTRAKEKLARWEYEGVESFLKNDSTLEFSQYHRTHEAVTPGDILSSLEEKYSSIRLRLLNEMAIQFCGAKTWEIISEYDKQELLDQVSVDEKRMRLNGLLRDNINSLPGATLNSANKFGSLSALMDSIEVNQETPTTLPSRATDYGNSLMGVKETYGTHLINLFGRFEKEKELFTKKKKLNPKQAKKRLEQYFCQLERQMVILKRHSEFSKSSLSVGLAERSSNSAHWDFDKRRYESMAAELLEAPVRTHHHHYQPVSKTMTSSELLNQGRMDIIKLILQEVEQRHYAEQLVMVKLLKHSIDKFVKCKPAALSKENIIQQLTALSNHRTTWRNGSSEYKTLQKDAHFQTLQSAFSLYYDGEAHVLLEEENHISSETQVNCFLLATLQLRQGQQFDRLIDDLISKQKTELVDTLKEEEAATLYEYCDTIACMVFGGVLCSESDKEYITILDEKYDEIRYQLVQHVLAHRMGETWFSRSDEEQQRHIAKLMADMKDLKDSGKTAQLEALVQPSTHNLSIWELMGENRLEFEKRINSVNPHRDETVPPGFDLFTSLEKRYYAEYAAVLEIAHKEEGSDLKPLRAHLNAEKYLIQISYNFVTSLYACGLQERIAAVFFENRHSQDWTRVDNLAKCVVADYFHRKKINQPYYVMKSEHMTQGSLTDYFEALLIETLLKHADEREMMMKLLCDESLAELREIAELMTREEMFKRLIELQNKQRWLLFDNEDGKDENMAILEEAAAIQYCLMIDIAAQTGLSIDESEIFVKLVHQLLVLQEKEMAFYVKNPGNVEKDDLIKSLSDEGEARKWNTCKNVSRVFTTYTGTRSDKLIINELRLKYEAMEYVLFKEAASHSGGNPEQDADKMKTLAKNKRMEGKPAEVAKIFKAVLPDEFIFNSLFGENSFEYSRKIMDFAMAKNLKLYSVEESSLTVQDPLNALTDRQEEEKQSYQNLLRGIYSVFLGEHGRMAIIVKLRLDRLKAKNSTSFCDMGRSLSISERTQLMTFVSKGNGNHGLMTSGDWTRLIDLAQSYVSSQITGTDLSFADVSHPEGYHSVVELMETIIEMTLCRQNVEITTLLEMACNVSQFTIDAISSESFDCSLQRLTEMATSHDQLAFTSQDVQMLVALKLKLWSEFDETHSATALILAELLFVHSLEIARCIYMFSEQTEEELKQWKNSFKENTTPKLIEALLDTAHLHKRNAEQISDAIQNKYDVLKDMLFQEILIDQLGESEWKKMSESERQKNILTLRQKEKQLRKQGKHDEAAALISERLMDSEMMRQMLDDELKLRLEERQARRQQRILDGMSELEAEALERAESEEDNTDLEFMRKDLLLDMDQRCQQEIDEVLLDMDSLKKEEWRDKKTMEELSRIRREQRLIKQEERFRAGNTLNKLLSMRARRQKPHRYYQDLLATERLAAWFGVGKVEDPSEVKVPMPDVDDILLLKEAVLTEVELKHKHERQQLLKLCKEGQKSSHQSAADESDQAACLEKITTFSILRKQLRHAAHFDFEWHKNLLMEASCYKLKIRHRQLDEQNKLATKNAVIISLLADLQEEQEKELQKLDADLVNMMPETLRHVKAMQCTIRKNHCLDNVAVVLLLSETSEDSNGLGDEVVVALKEKYDILKDKLILEGLMSQMGAAEWAALSEKEQQQKLMDIKLQQRRLKADGKHDEAKFLLNGLIDTEKMIDSMKSDQERMMRERAEQLRKKLATCPTNATEIQTELEGIETKLKKTSVLDNLEYEFESEKARLLALLQSQSDTEAAERLKQLELAKLKRQQRLIKKDEELDEVSALMHLAQKNEENRLRGIGQDMDMQIELARRRLAAKREKRQQSSHERDDEEIPEGIESVQERLLSSVEGKHASERKMLISIISHIEDDADYLDQIQHLSNVKIRLVLEKLEGEAMGCESKSREGASDSVWAEQKKTLAKILNKSMIYHLLLNMRAAQDTSGSEFTHEQLREENARILSLLQQKQQAELEQVNDLILKEDGGTLEKVKRAYLDSDTRGLYDNAIATVFGVLDDESKWSSEQSLNQIKEKFEHDKQELERQIAAGNDVIEKDGKEVNAQELLKKLEAEYNAQQSAMEAQMAKQNEMMLARRKARKVARFEEDTNVALKLLQMSEQHQAAYKDSTEQNRNKQGDLMRERLAKRKLARERQAELDRKAELEEASIPMTIGLKLKNGKRVTAADILRSSLPPQLGLKRERTVVSVSDDQKQEQLTQLIKEQDTVQKKMSQEQSKQEEMIRQKLLERKSRNVSAVAALLSTAERQKTTLERLRSEDRDRQITMVKERIARIQNEKTMTMRPRKKGAAFESLIDASAQGLTKDEQMKALAENLQKRFADESKELQKGTKTLKLDDEEEAPHATKILSMEEKQKILKERRLAKRKKKEAAQLADDSSV